MKTYLTDKIERRRLRAERKADSSAHHGKRSARVRAQSLANRLKYIRGSYGETQATAFLMGRPTVENAPW
jgi:hypothetical protein